MSAQIPSPPLAAARSQSQGPTSPSADAPPHLQRAPRLRPDQYIADSITRVGRFADIDPVRGRPLPTVVQVTAVAAWAAFTIESFRRAWAESRGGD